MTHNHQHSVQTPGFIELWNLEIVVVTLLFGALYLLLIGPWKTKFECSSTVGIGKRFAFFSALFIFFIVLGSPIDYYGHHFLFSFHMLQMALFYLVMPPLLIIGLPDWFYRSILRSEVILKPFLFLTHPLLSLVLFNMLFSFYHLPFVFDTLMGNHLLHNLFHATLLLTAFIMWWPIYCPLPELNKLSEMKKIGYMFAGGFLLTPVCAMIIFATGVIYTTYEGAPQLFAVLPTLDDQQLGGVIMKVIQELTYMTTIGVVFYQWAKRERGKEKELNSSVRTKEGMLGFYTTSKISTHEK
jgi:putative membrane protein